MKIPIYQIDAFASKVFSGNPAAVCPLKSWLDDSVLQAIAQENNLSEKSEESSEEDTVQVNIGEQDYGRQAGHSAPCAREVSCPTFVHEGPYRKARLGSYSFPGSLSSVFIQKKTVPLEHCRRFPLAHGDFKRVS